LIAAARSSTRVVRVRVSAQLALRLVGDVSGAQQPVAQEVGDPLRVFDVGLPAGDGPVVRGVGYQEGALAFEDVVHRLPENTSRLQPVGQGQQVGGHRPEGPQFLAALPVLRGAQVSR
jgi:hypothetical protein